MYFGRPNPIRQVACPKLPGIGEHVGVQFPSGHVVHKTQDGTKLVPLVEFAHGKPVREVARPDVAEYSSVVARVMQALQSPSDYRLLDSNCEQFASQLLTGVSLKVRKFEALFWLPLSSA